MIALTDIKSSVVGALETDFLRFDGKSRGGLWARYYSASALLFTPPRTVRFDKSHLMADVHADWRTGFQLGLEEGLRGSQAKSTHSFSFD